jgi:hypothetical protein
VSEPDDTKAVVVRRAGQLSQPRPPAATGSANVVPELARLAAGTWWRAVTWSLETSLTATGAVLRRATSGDPPASVLTGLASDARAAARRALGLGEQAAAPGAPEVLASAGTTDELRAQGGELLRRSNDVHVVEDTHPAFARILAEITPDEARILRFLYVDGAQPAVDVRTNRPFGVGSQLVEGGLSMIGEQAGCRSVERIHPYLTNLARLGMVDFSKEQVSNPQRYQLVEAQPKVADALKRAGRWPRTVHRSIALSSFGQEFCRTCLPLDAPAAIPVTDVRPTPPPRP